MVQIGKSCSLKVSREVSVHLHEVSQKPKISLFAISDITETTFRISATVDPLPSGSVVLEYGKTEALGSEINIGNVAGMTLLNQVVTPDPAILQPGDQFYCRLKVTNAVGDTFSTVLNGGLLNQFDELAPTDLAAVPFNDVQIDLTWTIASINADGHKVYISTDNVNFTLKGTVTGSTAAYSATALTANTKYYFKVVAYKNATESDPDTVDTTTHHAEIGVYITGLTTPLSSATKTKLNTLIGALKSAVSVTALSDFFDVFYVLGNETAEAALKNLVKNAHHATAVNSPDFVAFEGFTGNGLSAYLNTNYKAASQGVNFTQNNASQGVYVMTNVAEDKIIAGVINAALSGTTINIRSTSDTIGIRLNSAAATLGNSITDSRGYAAATRSNPTQISLFRNKVAIIENSNLNSSALVDLDEYILARNNNGTADVFTSRRVAMRYRGKAVSKAQSDAICDAIEAYMDSNGKGVIA